jgi:F-type H+-transporting ATPase subunit b
MELFKLLNANLVAVQIICFFLVLWLLKRFLWVPALMMLDQRRDRIASELKAVEDAKVTVAGLKKDYEMHLAKIDEEAQVKFKKIEREADERARELKDKGREEANQIIEDARQEIHFEVLRSREELKKDMVDMVVKVTEQMIQEKLTFEQDRKIIEGMLTEVDKDHEIQDHR